MSYVKSLKKSPFKTLSLTLGKMPDGRIWQSAFITQDGDAPSGYFNCHVDATAAERKGFLPLVKEALRRAQSIEELADLLKPFAVDLPVQQSEEDKARMQPTSTKAQLLHLMKNDNHTAAVEDVLNSGLLPDDLLQQWLNQVVERAIHSVLGRSGCPEWEGWAIKYLSGKDRTKSSCWAAAGAAAGAAGAAERKAQYEDLLVLINEL